MNKMTIQCPICRKEAASRDDPQRPNRSYPFCSERCQTIDLARWLDGKYQIPVEVDPDDADNESGGAADPA